MTPVRRTRRQRELRAQAIYAGLLAGAPLLFAGAWLTADPTWSAPVLALLGLTLALLVASWALLTASTRAGVRCQVSGVSTTPDTPIHAAQGTPVGVS